MAGSALDTTVLDSIATNIARRRPDRASSTWRWLIEPVVSAESGWVELGVADKADKADISIRSRRTWLTLSTVDVCNQFPFEIIPRNADNPQVWARLLEAPSGGRAAGSPAGRVSA